MRKFYFTMILLVCGWPVFCPADEVIITLDPGNVVGNVDKKIYGHFLEHIFHSVNGGLWGEMIWDRSFEGGAVAAARWSIEGDSLQQSNIYENARLVFGDPKWTDYEFTLEAQKLGGYEGFLVLFRVADEQHFYWANLGGWGNTRHTLERGTRGQGRWGAIGPSVNGRIQREKWYQIKIRCEGNHIQVWLDGKSLIDFTDYAGRHLAGHVGVGTWNTRARFRNLKVVSLDGKTLYQGLPDVEQIPAPAHTWEVYGQGKVYSTSEEPLNCALCRGIICETGETGVRQTPLFLRQGETYHGSLWACGSAPAGLVVRLLAGDDTLDEKMLPEPEDRWREYSFELRPDATAENGTIQVGVRGKGNVWIDQVSLMSEASMQTGGFRPDLLKAIADIKPPIIRWPGGSFVSNYRWKSGIGPQHKRIKYPRRIWDDVDINSFGTDEFIRLCRKIGAEPLIVVNIGMHDARSRRDQYCQEACDWVEYCNGPPESQWGKVRAANGHPEPYNVKHWEIDNEVWRLSPDDYASVLKQFVPAMKKVDPSIIIAACGSGQLGREWGRGDIRVIAECADLIDYLSIHHYESPNRFAEGPAAAEKFWRRLAGSIAESSNPNLKLYMSEWNAQSTDWRTGLYCGGILNVFEKCCDFLGMGGPALFLRHNSAQSWDNAFINFDHRGWFPAPNYVVMKLWREHYAPLRVQTTGDAGPLNGVATKTKDGMKLYYKVVNPGEQSVPVRLIVKEGFPIRAAAMQMITANSLEERNSLDNPHNIHPAAAKVDTEGQSVRFIMPAWSASIVSISRKM